MAKVWPQTMQVAGIDCLSCAYRTWIRSEVTVEKKLRRTAKCNPIYHLQHMYKISRLS